MNRYPTTSFDRAQDAAVESHNKSYLAQLEAAGPGACPNCLRTGGNWCWCCTDPAIVSAMDDEGLMDHTRYTNDDRHNRAQELQSELRAPTQRSSHEAQDHEPVGPG